MSANSPSLSQGQHFFAEFDFDGSPGCLTRKDTRVYLHPQNPATIVRKNGRCAGVVWMGNPGSAGKPTGTMGWVDIPPDPTLRIVLLMYRQAAAAKTTPPTPGPDDFILVMNCFYAVGPSHAAAYQQWIASGCSYRERIPKKARFIVVAWGADKPQGPVWRTMQSIRRRRKKMGSALFVVYIDAPISRGGAASISQHLAVMNYALHPLNPQFHANLADLAPALAPFV